MKGLGGMPGNLKALMDKAQKMQADILKAQEELQQYVADFQVGGGAVKVKMDGRYRILELEIAPEACEDREMLAEMVKAAVNQAADQIEVHLKEGLSKVTGGMSIPGLF